MLILNVCILLSISWTVSGDTGYGQFNGGSMSYVIRLNNVTWKYEAEIDLISGWVLNKGPCGPNCTKADIGKDTSASRASMESSIMDQFYFGNWSAETGPSKKIVSIDINGNIRANLNEHVIAVSEIGKWEQEHMTVVLELQPDGDAEDVVFEGHSWRDLPLQKPPSSSKKDPGLWHLQSKLDIRNRSDTGKPNASPKAFVKPFYRAKLNSITHINIPGIDPDGDIVKCRIAQYVEAGILSSYALPGVTVEENCTVTVNASASLNYTNDMWGGIALTVHDYNKAEITVGTKKALANKFSLGGTTVQFLVHVLENIYEPEFVTPTDRSNQQFFLYTGTTWSIDVYAKGTANTTVEELLVLGRQGETFTISPLKDDPRNQVKQATVSWKPEMKDIGSHIICVRAIDNTGIDSAEDRCFIIEVKEAAFHATNKTEGRPYFVDMPSYNETLKCDIDATCIFPIYVSSSEEIVSIKVEGTFDVSQVGTINVVFRNGSQLYESDLTLKHSSDMTEELCLTASDKNGLKSYRTCIKSEIISSDPCLSAPCLNSAACSRRVNDTADYQCKCLDNVRFEGKNCITKANTICEGESNPCVHGKCYPRGPNGFLCSCRANGWTGKTCSINENDCTPDPCNGHGICKDEVKHFTCACYERYNGTNCEHDLCPSKLDDEPTCKAALPGCSPNPCNSGMCLSGGSCVCQLGYSSNLNCSKETGDLNVLYANITFVPPTKSDRSEIVCYKGQNCTIPMFLSSPKSSSPTVNVEKVSEDLKNGVTIQSPAIWTKIPGMQNLYRSEVSVLGNDEGQKYICIAASDSHSTDERCFTITVITDPSSNPKSLEYKQKNREVKFIDPTPKSDTRYECLSGTQYRLFLYTTKASDNTCKTIIPSDDSVHVFKPTTTSSNTCKTEVAYTFSVDGPLHICFQSSHNTSQSQSRCFDFIVRHEDVCSKSPCQNEGECFPNKKTASVYCQCQPGYAGSHCEKGPCLTSDNICTNGYCYVNNHNVTCLCPVGFKGRLCDQSLPDLIPDPYTTGAKYTDTAQIRTVTCVRNRPCSLSLVSSGKYSTTDRPTVVPGYVHPTISILDLYTEVIRPGSFISSIIIRGRQTGTNDLCIQTVNKDRVNEDEVCIKVIVTEETSAVWVEKEKPHFINPTLPPNTDLTCLGSDPCHVVFYATPGESAQSDECVELHLTSDKALLSHDFSPCDNCSAVQTTKNCSFDVVMYPASKTEICVTAVTSITQTSGEKRCYNVYVEPVPAPFGCQVLHCINGGFCDGHDTSPICHCPLPFSGTDCRTDTSLTSSSSPKAFNAEFGMPQTAKCYQNSPCIIPFVTVGPLQTIRMGYVSPGLDVISSNITENLTTKQQTGTVTVTSLTLGKHRYCMQLVSGSTVDDELCMAVFVEAGTAPTSAKGKPHFVQPTLPKDMTILCEADRACHLDLHFIAGSVFNPTEPCPTITDVSSEAGHRVHIFSSVKGPIACTSDVSYIPPASAFDSDELLCFEVTLPSKRGERRCFNFHIVASVQNEILRPCLSKTCEQGAKCIAEIPVDDKDPVISSCVCTRGFGGNDCTTAVSTTDDLVGVEGINFTTSPNYTSVNTPHFDSTIGIPDHVKCEINKPCSVDIPYHGQQNHPPVPGHLDTGINVTSVSETSIDSTSHITTLSLTTQQVGNYTMCVQTTVAGEKRGENVDEICFIVEVLAPGSLVQHVSQDLAGVPDDVTVTCNTNSMCHLTFATSTTTVCPVVRECGAGIPGAQIYSSVTNTNVCVVDMAIRTKTQESLQDVCLTTLNTIEEKHITLYTKVNTEYGPCQKLHCKNGGFCDNVNGTAVCRCINFYTGLQCEIDPCTAALPEVKRANHTKDLNFPDGFRVNYTCWNGYEFTNSDSNGFTCRAANNSWVGGQPECIAKKLCFNDSDCLNGGICSSNVCNCADRYNNTNCDTAVCTPPKLNLPHTNLVGQVGWYIDGSNITYQCDPGYKATLNSSFIYMCNTSDDKWYGQGLVCTAKEHCDNDNDCLHSGKCEGNVCNCTEGFGNSNCDTAVCDKQVPVVTHAVPNTVTNLQSNGSKRVYTCDNGYTMGTGFSDFVVCNTGLNQWEGTPTPCVAIQSCTKHEDCLNAGTCDKAHSKCNCTNDYINTNCDTAVCTSIPPTMNHTIKNTGNGTYTDGFVITYTCARGYTANVTSSDLVCQVGNNTWTGKRLDCQPVVSCTNDTDCLNSGHCNKPNKTCVCVSAFSGTNCAIGPCNSSPRLVTNGNYTIKSNYYHGQVVKITCNPDYQLKDPSDDSFTCDSATQTWSGDPVCIETPKCTVPLPDIQHAINKTDPGTSFDGTMVIYQCEPGYRQMQGPSLYTCNASANAWDGIGLVCIPKENCDTNADCLNSGLCNAKTCSCQPGYGNPNCDTAVCDRPFPVVTHATSHVKNTTVLYINATEVAYKCGKGYAFPSGSANSVICNVNLNKWEGLLEKCSPIQKCSKNEDCLNSGSCDVPKQTCLCKPGFGNTNCDTALCSSPLPEFTHTDKDTGNGTYTDGFPVVYKCSSGYTASASTTTLICDVHNNVWNGNNITCSAVVNCASDSDCLNSGTCNHVKRRCVCSTGYANTNCDTAVCSTPIPAVPRATLKAVSTLYTDGFNITYACKPGYKATSNSSTVCTCDVSKNAWKCQGLTCVAKGQCDSNADCLNSGSCITSSCKCSSGFGNSNCDTAVCDTPIPTVLKAIPHQNNTTKWSLNGTEVVYACERGYTTISSGLSNSVKCNAATNKWEGHLQNCTAMQKCTQNADCLNGGTCQIPTQTCDCVTGYGNTNCDTKVCSSPPKDFIHADKKTGNGTFSNGFTVVYKCRPGYVTDVSTTSMTCDAINDQWTGNPINCTAIVNCTDRKDCLNNGTCDQSSHRCQCAQGYSNTNCDTGPCTSTPVPLQHGRYNMNGTYQHGQSVNATCDSGYEFEDSAQTRVTCDSTSQTWTGNPVCVKTPVCSQNFPTVTHGSVVKTNDLYVDEYILNITCLPGYQLKNVLKYGIQCKVTEDRWILQSDVQCIPKEFCDNSNDCIHGRCYTNQTCVCEPGFQNSNCDTQVPVALGTCNVARAASKAGMVAKVRVRTRQDHDHLRVGRWTGHIVDEHEAVKQGLTSCYCIVQTHDGSSTKKLQIIKRRPVITMTQILTAAGMGAGGMTGGVAVAVILYIVVKKVKKSKTGKRPQPTPSPRVAPM